MTYTNWTKPNPASSAVASYRYSSQEQNLQITFVGGKQAYDYPCTDQQFELFLNAASKGQYVDKVLKPGL